MIHNYYFLSVIPLFLKRSVTILQLVCKSYNYRSLSEFGDMLEQSMIDFFFIYKRPKVVRLVHVCTKLKIKNSSVHSNSTHGVQIRMLKSNEKTIIKSPHHIISIRMKGTFKMLLCCFSYGFHPS